MHSRALYNKTKGFTLIEMSAVILIIGLITAGIFSGQTLLSKAKFRSVIADINKFTTATTAFKTQYGAFPGDMPNAQSYWPTANANGNGDGVITESWGFWQHLALSGYLPGTYSGIVNSGTFQPTSKFTTGFYRAAAATSTNTLYGRSGNLFILEGNIGGIGMSGVVVAENASYAIDLKMDDGLADKGNVYATTPDTIAGEAGECTTGSWSSGSAAAIYNLSVTDKYCRVIFWF